MNNNITLKNIFDYLKLCIITIALFCSCNNIPIEQEKTIDSSENYPDTIVKLGFQLQYDEAKWLYYASHFKNDTVICVLSPNILEKNIIYFDTYTEYYKITNDTFCLTLYPIDPNKCRPCYTSKPMPKKKFYFRKEEKYPFMAVNESAFILLNIKQNYNGHVYNGLEILEDSSKYGFKFYREKGIYPLDEQEVEFENYIKQNKDKLCPWLYKEAQKRKVIK